MIDAIEKTVSDLSSLDILSKEQLSIIQSCFPAILIEYNALNQNFCDEYVLCDKDFPTSDSKYYQSIRELNNRLFRLIFAVLSYQEIEIDIEQLQSQIPDNIFDQKKANIKLQREKLKLIGTQNEIKSLFKDVEIWKGLSEKYYRPDIQNFGKVREEEMIEKKKILSFMNEKLGIKLSESQMGLFIKKDKQLSIKLRTLPVEKE